MADADGETYAVDVNASQLRINLSYNSAQMEGNLAEVKVYGTRIGDAQTYETNIETTDFSEHSGLRNTSVSRMMKNMRTEDDQ